MELIHNLHNRSQPQNTKILCLILRDILKRQAFRPVRREPLLAEPSQSSFVLFSLCTPPLPPEGSSMDGWVIGNPPSLHPSGRNKKSFK